MREINEQWIENGRMYKAVEGIPNFCIGCCWSDAYHCCGVEDCPANHIKTGLIIRVLGPVNEEGLLPCPFCGEFPVIEEHFEQTDIHCNNDICLNAFTIRETKQQAIAAWNRRN